MMDSEIDYVYPSTGDYSLQAIDRVNELEERSEVFIHFQFLGCEN